MTSLTRPAKIASVISLAIVAIYIFVTIVLVVPPGAFRTAFNGIVSASSPYFSQKWNVFAPNIMKSNNTLAIQAQWVGDDGKLVKSDWVNMTEIEQQSVPGHAIPSRIQKSSWNAMLAYNKRYVGLNEAQRDVVRDTFIERHDDGYRAKRADALVDQLDELGGSRGDVVRFLRYDYMLKEYATDFATAYFDKDIVRVRWQIQRTRPNDFEHRFDDEKQFKKSTVTYGWRHVDDVIDPEVIAVYEDVIERYDR